MDLPWTLLIVMLIVGMLFLAVSRSKDQRVLFLGMIAASTAALFRPGVGGRLVGTFAAVQLVLFWICVLLERLWPRNRYALVSEDGARSIATMPFRAMALVALPALLIIPWQRSVFPSLGLDQVRHVSLVTQVVLATLLADFAMYGIHRAQHASSFYWKFHMPHHATRELSAIANHRTHIVELALVQVGSRVVIFKLLGISPDAALASNLIAYTVAGSLSHANIDFPSARWRWLGYLIVLPNFHARHHALDQASSNFSETFPIWDLLLGTFEMPNEKLTRFGIDDEAFTAKSVFAQHLYPLTSHATSSAPSRDMGADQRAA